jgi:magnesium transporter
LNGHNGLNSEQQKLLHLLAFSPARRMELFRELLPEERPAIVRLLSKQTRTAILAKLDDDELAQLINSVDPDEATDLLRLVDRRRRNNVLMLVSEELKDAVSMLLEFDPDTAAGLMTLDYVQVDEDSTVAEVAEKFRVHEKRTGRLPVIIVMRGGQLRGFLPIHQLALAERSEQIGQYVRRMQFVRHNTRHAEVLQLFKTHPHNKIAVLNDDDSVLGIIYSDDVLKLLHEKDAASLYRLAGVSDEETVTDTAERKVKFRYKWLIINLATAFLAAFTVGRFEDVLSKYVLLAIYMPIVAGMGGNAATQTLAVMVRGIALRQVSLRSAMRTLRSELGAGFINGVINGVLVALVVIIMNHDLSIALILAMAMVANLLVAAVFGTLVPLILARLGKDPATSATVFITTATDVLGFLAFLGLASLILN